MRVKLQLVICHDDGHEETVTDVITLNKNNQRIEQLGLTLAESKQLLSILQRHFLQQQITTFLNRHSTCPDCGTPFNLKARGSRSFRTLFGTFKFYSPRLEHCDCKRHKTVSFRPLSALLTEPVSPELPHSTEFRGKAPIPFVIPLQLCSHTPILGHQPHQPSDLKVTHAKHSPPDPCKPDHHR
jgi:hypothetical protein